MRLCPIGNPSTLAPYKAYFKGEVDGFEDAKRRIIELLK